MSVAALAPPRPPVGSALGGRFGGRSPPLGPRRGQNQLGGPGEQPSTRAAGAQGVRGLGDGDLILIDELLTPDSSRFWDAAAYQPGATPASFDKQYLRDWLDESGWDKEAPPPELPADVVANTRARYFEALERLTPRGL